MKRFSETPSADAPKPNTVIAVRHLLTVMRLGGFSVSHSSSEYHCLLHGEYIGVLLGTQQNVQQRLSFLNRVWQATSYSPFDIVHFSLSLTAQRSLVSRSDSPH